MKLYYYSQITGVKSEKAYKNKMSYLPFYIKGEVVKGFGRGSKDLGCPTGTVLREVQHFCSFKH